MSRVRRSLLLSLLCLGAFLCLQGRAPAADAATQLIRLVPDDVGFCMVVEDVREHSARLAGSPLVKALRESPLGKAAELQQLEALDQLFQKLLDVELSKVRDDIVGDAVVFAYRPGPPGKPQEEQGLVLVQARDAKLLEALIDKLNKAQKQSGELKELTPCEHQGERYFRRVQDKGEDFYAIRGGTFLLATKEGLMRQTLARMKDPKSESPLERQLRVPGPGKPLASLWINPRAFDAEMAHNLEAAKGNDAAFLKNILRYWKALDAITISLALDADIHLNLSVEARPDALPPAARRFFEEASQPSALLGKLPPDALFACAGRIQFESLFEMIAEFLTPEDSKSLHRTLDGAFRAAAGREFFKDVLPCLGPEHAICITAPPPQDKNWFPHIFLALAVSSGKDKENPVDEAILEAVNWAVTTAVNAHNQLSENQLRIHSTMVDKIKVKYVESDQEFPPGFRPAFALQHGFLTFGSCPEAVQRAAAILTSKATPRDDQPFLWMSIKHLRAYLKDRRGPITDYLAQKDKIENKEAAKRLDGLLSILELIDRVEVTQHSHSGKTTLGLRVQMTQPLK